MCFCVHFSASGERWRMAEVHTRAGWIRLRFRPCVGFVQLSGGVCFSSSSPEGKDQSPTLSGRRTPAFAGEDDLIARDTSWRKSTHQRLAVTLRSFVFPLGSGRRLRRPSHQRLQPTRAAGSSLSPHESWVRSRTDRHALRGSRLLRHHAKSATYLLLQEMDPAFATMTV